MSNEWKMVPVEPTAEMEDVGCQAYMDAEGMIRIMHKSSMGHAFQAMLAAAPVPPAGDVEVLRNRLERARARFSRWNGRLIESLRQARARLEEALVDCQANRHEREVVCANYEVLKAELTKARDLSPANWTDRQVLDFLGVALRNVDLVGEVRLSEIRQGFQYMQERQHANFIACNVDESCGQDAEAAKGGA